MQKLYYGGDIITMREEGDAPEALLAADGKIVYVGELAEARKRCLPEAEEIDLKGRTLMPSFIDPHSHISMLAQYTDFANLKSAHTVTLGLGYHTGSFYADLAYKYDTYKADFYPFMAEGIQPMKETDSRSKVLLTLGYRF